VRISVSPVAGGTLVLDSRPSDAARADMRRRAWRGAVAVLLVLGALLFAIRQTTRPIARLNEGVRRFGSALSAPDVVPAGSAELRELAVAFNDMKARIAGLVEERTRILAAVAHDLRTYLTRLRLRADYIVDDEQRSRAENDLSEMAALLDDTLLFAKPRQRRSFGQSINVADELVAVASIRRDAGQEVSVDLEGIGRATTIMVDPLSLRRMLANLLDNGLRYGSHVMLAASQSGSAVAISVCDDGPGVPDELLRRLGEPYLRVESSRDRSTGGAGLGLAIVRALAAENGAELQLANLAPGFRASILFPATAASPTVAQPSRWLSGE
jgi:signal transduction histidine kinase